MGKAEKELESKGYHRGLVKGKADRDRAGQHIAKAEHNLAAAQYFHKGGFSDWSASAFFYCIYHCFLAIIQCFGYSSRNQECTIACVEMLREEGRISVEDRFTDTLRLGVESEGSILGLREHYQYGIEIEFSDEAEMKRLTLLCRDMLDRTRDIAYKRQL